MAKSAIRVQYLAVKEEIDEALNAGERMATIYRDLVEKGKIDMCFASFTIAIKNNHLQKPFIKKKHPKSSPHTTPSRTFTHNNVVDPQKIKDLQNKRSETAIPKLKITSYKNK